MEERLSRLEDAILGRDGLLAQVAAIRVILSRLEGAEHESRERCLAAVSRAECDRRHTEAAAWARAIVPALVGAGLGLFVSLLMRGLA